MFVLRRIRPLLILAVAVGCASDRIPSGGPDLHAAASRACGPADGPAVEIYLAHAPVDPATPPTPHYRIYIWETRDRLGGRSWRVAGDDAEGGAWFHPNATDFEIATRGTVVVTAVAPDGTIEGWADLTFPGARRVSGAFRAPWHERPMLCG